jgi:hypothetical protein
MKSEEIDYIMTVYKIKRIFTKIIYLNIDVIFNLNNQLTLFESSLVGFMESINC